jgi:UDP-glucose 4-epimerase
MSNPPKCLIIGANGFIGSHLVDELVEQNYMVRALDRYSRPPQFGSSGNVKVFKGDVFDDDVVSKALENIDYVFHAFSATTPFTSDSDPYSDIDRNILRNVQLLEKIVSAHVKKVVFISSGGVVYGHIAEERAAKETDAPNPVSPYGISKLATEYYLAYFNRKYGLNYIIYRLTNPYGPRQITHNNQGVIPLFINKIQSGEKIIIYGDGNSSRDYIYIRDAAQMITNTFSRETQYAVYNIGSGHQTTLNSIIATIEKITGHKAKLEYKEAPKTFLRKTMISTDRFHHEFMLKSETPLEEGLRLVCASLDMNY